MFKTQTASLTENQLDVLREKIGGKQTVIVAGVAKIHTKHQNDFKFTYSGLFGALAYMIDRSLQVRVIKLFELTSYQVMFEMKVTKMFVSAYQKMNDYFSFFHYKNSTIGFSFAEYEDSYNFSRAIKQHTLDNTDNFNLYRSKSSISNKFTRKIALTLNPCKKINKIELF